MGTFTSTMVRATTAWWNVGPEDANHPSVNSDAVLIANGVYVGLKLLLANVDGIGADELVVLDFGNNVKAYAGGGFDSTFETEGLTSLQHGLFSPMEIHLVLVSLQRQ